MGPLPTYRRVLVWFSVCPPPECTVEWKKRVFLIFPIVIIASVASIVITSVLLLFQSTSIDLKEALYVVFQIAAAISMVYVVVMALLSRNKFNAILDDLSAIYQKSKRRIL